MANGHDWEEEELFPSIRKEQRNERKAASRRDRSKFKVTDQRQMKKAKAAIDPSKYSRGRVLEATSQGWQVECDGVSYSCSLRGALKKERQRAKNLVTVGDFVLFDILPDNEGAIAHVEERKSVLSRADNLSRRKEQLIAANIDQVLITTSVVSPPLKPTLIDRYIIAARKGKMEPVIVINKADLLSEDNTEFDEEYRLWQGELLNMCQEGYQELGIPFIVVSADEGEGLDALREVMKDKASVFSGQSGVGKTSLINIITGRDLRIGDVVEKTKKGAHTTTTTTLLRLEQGGWCVDTPGIKSFGVWDLEQSEIEAFYSEIHEYGSRCRFPNCTHHEEPQCAVKDAVETEEISPLRYDSYLTLCESVEAVHKRR